jgi:hypothetical protein
MGTVLDTFGKVRPFSNIILSEERHISYLQPLIYRPCAGIFLQTKAKTWSLKPKTFAEALKFRHADRN